MPLYELNLDGIIGPMHNYAGLSPGNLASQGSVGKVSSPRRAALQGLEKMRLLMELGVPQAVLPPQERPNISALRGIGFSGSEEEVIAAAFRDAPHLAAAVFSASSMWAANAATISPSCDSLVHRVHIAPANLAFNFHRSLEPAFTSRVLRTIFPGRRFVHHEPLPSGMNLRDEGAANHMRLAGADSNHTQPPPCGLHVFVYGDRPATRARPQRERYVARQTFDASLAAARLLGIPATHVLFVRQNPGAVDAGVFHNDVIATSHDDLLLVHEDAYEDRGAIDAIRRKFASLMRRELNAVVIRRRELSVRAAVRSYLFNSQIVTDADRRRVMICPVECREQPRVKELIHHTVMPKAGIDAVRFVDLRQSMDNGGGPACLRLRVPLTTGELSAMHSGVRLTAALHRKLVTWVHSHYRDSLSPGDLADPALRRESCEALDQLSRILRLGTIYDFQR